MKPQRSLMEKILKILRIASGSILTLIGLPGLAPFIPGGFLFFIGIGTIAQEVPWVEQHIAPLKRWWERQVDYAENLFLRWFPRGYPRIKVWVFQTTAEAQVLLRFFGTS